MSESSLALPRPSAGAGILLVFSLTLFMSAFLLFQVQPLFAKMVLPLLGGSPSVWSVLMVCFQGVLLFGYAYAYALTRLLDSRRAVIVHIGMLAVASLALPIAVSPEWRAPPQSAPEFWLIGLFAVSVGIPFFAVSANAPLLQAWFARTGHHSAKDPYFLYGASNIGSFFALLSYPLAFEPLFTLDTQSRIWSTGFGFLVFCIAVCGVRARLRDKGPTSTNIAAAARIRGGAPSWSDRMTWIALAFVPSGLLVAVTSHISTDVASAPFLWVVPLSMFLLTFVFVFRQNPLPWQSWLRTALPFLVLPLVLGASTFIRPFTLSLVYHLALFFIAALVCHGLLYGRRPDPAHLTGFYLWMSFGGVLGGIFTSLIAPNLFSTVVEYPLLALAAAACGLCAWQCRLAQWSRNAWIVALTAGGLVVPPTLGIPSPFEIKGVLLGVVVFVLAALVLERKNTVRFVYLGVSVIAITTVYPLKLSPVANFRSFYGVNKIVETPDGQFRLLLHGTTLHGAVKRSEQGSLDQDDFWLNQPKIMNLIDSHNLVRDASGTEGPRKRKPVPTFSHPTLAPTAPLTAQTYYYPGSPLAQIVANAQKGAGAPRAVAVIGLGVGSLACYRKDGEQWTFFEIDRQVASIARNKDYFGFLPRCAPDAPIVIGDARLTLQNEDDEKFDAIIVDAFSSDAIPVHLLTRESFAIYLRKLAPGGVVAFHISNRHLELGSVIAAIGAEFGVHTLYNHARVTAASAEDLKSSSIVVAAARSLDDMSGLTRPEGWQEIEATPQVAPWTDDYSDILSAIVRKIRDEIPGLKPL